VKVNATCGSGAAVKRPGRIFFYCGDNGMYADGISWRSWGGRRARGFGTVYRKTCSPDCASGGIRHSAGKITLSRKVRCGRHHYRYSRIRVKAYGGPTRSVPLVTCR